MASLLSQKIKDTLHFKIEEYLTFKSEVPSAERFQNVNVNILLAALKKLGHGVYVDTNKLNIVGIRYSNAHSNSFDDLICYFYKTASGDWNFTKNIATTDPGTYYVGNFENPHGVAILKPGQYVDSYQLGLHRGKYEALTQRKEVTVYRDANRDKGHDYINPQSGFFGINIHRATANGTSILVDKWSAGCQVFATSSDYQRFIACCKSHKEQYGNIFTYTLINKEDL